MSGHRPIQYAQLARAVPTIERNRSGWLIAFGVVSILIGAAAGCGVMTLLALASQMSPFLQMGPLPFEAIVIFGMFIAIYAASAVLFIWAGVDSIRCRRWVRPVAISVGWLTIVGTIFTLASMAVSLNQPEATLVQPPGPTTTTMTTTTTTMPTTAPTTMMSPSSGLGPSERTYLVRYMIAFFFLGIVLPGAFVGFYSTSAVRDTLAAYDPTPSWTQQCTLPVFVAATGLLLGGLMTLPVTIVGATPFFGTYLAGAASTATTGAAAVLLIVAAALVLLRQRAGWWLALTVITLGFASTAMTLARLGSREFFRRGGMTPDDTIGLPASGAAPLIFTIAGALVCVTYLLWIRRDVGLRAPDQ